MIRLAAVFGMCLLCCSVVWAVEKTKVVVVSGGHDFDEKGFQRIFRDTSDLDVTFVTLKDDSEIFEHIDSWPYDVIVLYNMTQNISEHRRANFLKLLDQGVGLVVLHHAIAAYSQWPEFAKIIGVKYYLEDTDENGVKHPRSTYVHGVDYPLQIEDSNHPITRGMKDFTINDETYKGYTYAPDNHLIVSTNHETSQREIAWTRSYGKAKVCYIEPGHGPQVFADANYRRLVLQGTRWAARK